MLISVIVIGMIFITFVVTACVFIGREKGHSDSCSHCVGCPFSDNCRNNSDEGSENN